MRASLLGLALLLGGCASIQAPSCGRDCLIGAAREIANGAATAAGAKVTENGAAVSTTWLKGATSIHIHGEYGDADDAIVAGTGNGADGKPAVFGLRVKGGKAPKEVELVFAREGEVSLSPPSIPLTRNPLFDQAVPEGQRTSPEKMIAAANAYFDGIEKTDGSKVPVTAECNRVENGVQTTRSTRFSNLPCNGLEVFAYIPEVRERRVPIVDVKRGVVVMAVAFWIPGGDYKRVVNGQETVRHYEPRSLFLFEAFKIVDGKIAQIEATMRNMPLGTKMGW